jgi:hypothetical protein
MVDPAEKYRNNVSPEHKLAMDTIGFLYQNLKAVKPHLETLLEAEHHMHNVGHILDPTLYRDMIYSKSFERQKKLARAALQFLNEVDAVVVELEAELEPRP